MKRIVVGISGATGAPLAVKVFEFLRDLERQVMWAISTKVNPKCDTVAIPDLSVLTLDPGSEPPGISHKMIIDATTPVPPEKHGEYSMQVMDPLEAKDWLPKLQALMKHA